MTPEDAYEHACVLWGPTAGVWRAGSTRVVVGRWVDVLSTLPQILKTQRHGLYVLGEGRNWLEAFAMVGA